jgi:uncharacterized iron-regulated membrane protein
MGRKTRMIFAIHSWTGLISGIFILSFFLTGSLIVFRKELNEWQHPHLFKTSQRGEYLPYDSLYRNARVKEPVLFLYSFRYIPQQPTETIEMRVYDPKRKKYGLLYLDPYSGEVLGTTWNNSIYDLLLTMHYTFFLGRVGELLAAIFALALLIGMITGLIVYRNSLVRLFTFSMKMKWRNWRMVSSNLHHIVGVWGLIFNLILAGSGFYMMLYAFDLKTQFASNAEKSLGPPPEIGISIDLLISRTQTLFNNGKFVYLDFPRNEGEPLTVYTDGGFWLWGDLNNKVEFDPRQGHVRKQLGVNDLGTGEKIEYALYTLHYGQYGGLTIKIIYSLFALAGAVLSVTGFALWYRKKIRHE